ncbi:MAG: hypothetical protein WC838_03705 [Candidatus Margulisiibacteriota bacterium]|jgi:hypothetical protein
MKRYSATILIFLLSGLIAQAVMTPVIPYVSKGHKTVGDVFTYRYELPALPAIPSISLSFQDPSGNEDVLVLTQSVTSKKNKTVFEAKVVSFKVGVINFPTADIFGNAIDAVAVTINTVITTTKNIKLQDDVPPYQDYSDLLLLLLVLILIASGAFGWVKYQEQVKLRQTILTPEQKHDRWAEACKYFTLTEMPDNVKEYYVKASEILKNIFKIESDLDLLDLTSEESKELLKHRPAAQQEALLACLDSADLVKFAKYYPDPNEFLEFEKTALVFLKAHEPKQAEEAQV